MQLITVTGSQILVMLRESCPPLLVRWEKAWFALDDGRVKEAVPPDERS